MISVPVAVHNDNFKWQLDLFWYNHRQTYGNNAKSKAFAIIINQDWFTDPEYKQCEWNIDIPHQMCDPFFKCLDNREELENYQDSILFKPLNIQLGLKQIIDQFDNEQIIEVLDCDMFHFKPHPEIVVQDDQLLVSTIYEPWHLFATSKLRYVIQPYFLNNGKYYNGGFVPIIGKVKTFKKILKDWINIHRTIMHQKIEFNMRWWGGMYALSAACERNCITMTDYDTCYVPPVNNLLDTHYIGHYSVDSKFNKRIFPSINFDNFLDNEFYNRIRDWYPNRV